MLLAIGGDKPEPGLGRGPGSPESHLWAPGQRPWEPGEPPVGTWAAAALLLYSQGQDGAVLRRPPTPVGPWLQTQVGKGQAKPLPPSSPALYSGAPNAVAVAALGKEPTWPGTGKASSGADCLSSCSHTAPAPFPALPPSEAPGPLPSRRWAM